MQEIEIKILGINVEDVSKKLIDIGAHKEFSGLIKTKYFDKDSEIRDRGDLLRVREFEGSHTEATYKTNKRKEDGFKIYDEYELASPEFNEACKFFESLGFETSCYFEKRRTVFSLKQAEIVIDEYPKISPFLEIEAPDQKIINDLIEKLDLRENEKSSHTINRLLKEKYPDIQLNNLTF
jgi:adenylate cyclase class 2